MLLPALLQPVPHLQSWLEKGLPQQILLTVLQQKHPPGSIELQMQLQTLSCNLDPIGIRCKLHGCSDTPIIVCLYAPSAWAHPALLWEPSLNPTIPKSREPKHLRSIQIYNKTGSAGSARQVLQLWLNEPVVSQG